MILGGFTRPSPPRPPKPLAAADARAATRSKAPAHSREPPGRGCPSGCGRSPRAETAVKPSWRVSGCRGSEIIEADRRLIAIDVGVKEAPEGSQCRNGNRGRRHQPGSAARARLCHPLRDLGSGPVGKDDDKTRLPAPDVAAADFQLQFTTAQRMPGIADDNTGFVSITSPVRRDRESRTSRARSATRPAAPASPRATTATSPAFSTNSPSPGATGMRNNPGPRWSCPPERHTLWGNPRKEPHP